MLLNCNVFVTFNYYYYTYMRCAWEIIWAFPSHPIRINLEPFYCIWTQKHSHTQILRLQPLFAFTLVVVVVVFCGVARWCNRIIALHMHTHEHTLVYVYCVHQLVVLNKHTHSRTHTFTRKLTWIQHECDARELIGAGKITETSAAAFCAPHTWNKHAHAFYLLYIFIACTQFNHKTEQHTNAARHLFSNPSSPIMNMHKHWTIK